MGATLETIKVEATTAKEAAVKIIYGCGTDDPYSGDFNTCSEYTDLTYGIREDEFEKYVAENGEKRRLYILKDSPTEYIGWAWCAC